MKLCLPFSNKNYYYSSGYLLFFFAAWSLWWSFYAIWLKSNLGLSGAALGKIYSINQFASIIFMILYGIIQDKLGTRKSLMWLIGIVLVLSGPFLIYIYEPLLASKIEAKIILGTVLGAIFFSIGYLSACGLIDSFVEKISRKFNFEYGTARFWGCIGYAGGTFLGGLFFSLNPHINFWGVSIMGILFLIVNLFYKTTDKSTDKKELEQTDLQHKEQFVNIGVNDFLVILKNSKFWAMVLFIIGTWSFYNIYDQQLFPVFYQSLFSNPETGVKVYGYLNSVQVVLEALGMAFIPFLINRIGPKPALILGSIIMTCRILGAAMFTDVYIISFIKLLHALEVPLFVIAIFKYNAANFDKRLSSTIFLIGFQIATSVGIIILSIPIGHLFDLVGYHQLFYMISLVVVVSFVIGIFTLSNKKVILNDDV